MQKLAKKLSVVMALVMTLSLFVSFAPTAKAAANYPQVQYATEPKLEYQAGDIVNFDLYTPNYGGRVQYRVVLWNDETKSYRDLWTNTPDRYYANWMPYGNNIFNLHWKIDEPGHYRITIYAKRAGIPNNECYLKGFNCDSYMESDSFVVKAKEVAKTPDVPADSLKLTGKSTQKIVGQEYEVKANVGKAGVRVIFQVDAPADSLNKDITGEALSDANGNATFKYTRQYADADYVIAYPAASPSVRDAEKVYWGITPILTVAGYDDSTTANNGNVKKFKVKLNNPLTGQPMRYKEVKVMLKENIDTKELGSTAVVTNDFNGVRVTPYQRTHNIIPGGLNEVTLSLVTNDNGEATFTVTGYNTSATPIVYYDSYEFFNELPIVQLGYLDDSHRGETLKWDPTTKTWVWSLQVPAPIVLPDSGQYAPTFAGNYNCRLDATELQAEATTVKFVTLPYTFETSMTNGDIYVAVDKKMESGREFKVTVKKPDGNVFANGTLMVRLEQLFDNNLNNDCEAKIIDGDKLEDSVELTLDSKGRAWFTVVSDELNDIATPRIWIDQDTPNYPKNGNRDGRYTDGEPTKVLETLYFVNRAVASGTFEAAIADDLLIGNTDENDNVINLGGYETKYTFTLEDQNGEAWKPKNALALVTYTLFNDGANPVYIEVPNMIEVKLNDDEMKKTVKLLAGDTITISGISDKAVNALFAYTDECKSGKLIVDAHAITTSSDSRTWWQPSNTSYGAVLGDATLTTFWKSYTKFFDGDAFNLTQGKTYTGTVEFMYGLKDDDDVFTGEDREDNFVVIKRADGSYVQINYTAFDPLYNVKYEDSDGQIDPVYDVENFENQISLDDEYRFMRNEHCNHTLLNN